jgi:hypothetical protein
VAALGFELRTPTESLRLSSASLLFVNAAVAAAGVWWLLDDAGHRAAANAWVFGLAGAHVVLGTLVLRSRASREIGLLLCGVAAALAGVAITVTLDGRPIKTPSGKVVVVPKREIAESFFNSLTRRIFATEGVDQAIEFVDTDFDEAPTTPLDNRRTYSGASIHELLIASLTDPATGFAGEHWCNLDATARLAGERIQAASRASQQQTPANGTPRFEMIGNIFYRGRGAYLVGRAFRDKGDKAPVAIALSLRHENETGIDLDAILIGETDLAILFSFTRAYFRVDTECPYELVRSLPQGNAAQSQPAAHDIFFNSAIQSIRAGRPCAYFPGHGGRSHDAGRQLPAS